MNRTCNPNNSKSQDHGYECNPITGRWNKKKVVNPKSLDDNYEYNMKTKRWIRKKLMMPINLVNRHIDELINTRIPKTMKKVIKNNPGVLNKPYNEVFKALNREGSFKNTSAAGLFYTFMCKHMEKSCPLDCDLEGTSWCKFNQKDVFYYESKGLVYCYNICELCRIIHNAFISTDNSHLVRVPMLKVPKDVYTNKVMDRHFIQNLKERLKTIRETNLFDMHPELAYFFRNYNAFYDDPAIQKLMEDDYPNKVQLSRAIQRFFTRSGELEWKLGRVAFRYGDARTTEHARWVFKEGKHPRNIFRYVFYKYKNP